MRQSLVLLALVHLFALTALPNDRKTAVPIPDHFVIGRDTFFDFGPPFHYVELLFVNSDGEGSSIQKVLLTPGYKCTLAPKFETARTSLRESVADLFGSTNPCAIPEKDLNRELKRRKHYLVFSGANVSMQVQCGGQNRIIRSDILDRDMFDPHPDTPEHTSWTMGILDQLDQALGPAAMGKPMITLPDDPAGSAQVPDSPIFQEIGAGKYDSLFSGTDDTPSQIYISSKNAIPAPTVQLLKSLPFQPIVAPLPKYPAIARLAKVEGTLTFTVDIQPDGGTTNFVVEQGAPLFAAVMATASHDWTFPREAAGQRIAVTVEFALNCPYKD